MEAAMHEHALEAGRDRDGRGVGVRPQERHDPRRSVVARSSHDGHGLADQAEPTPADRRSGGSEAQMARVRASGGQQPREYGGARRADAVAALGGGASADASSVRAQGEPPVVTGPVSTANVLAILARQRFRCNLTGRPLTPDTAALDHIVPVRCGGEHVIENTQVLHKDVNRAKNSMTNDEFIALCADVVCWTAHHT
jgi:hypothetical protein